MKYPRYQIKINPLSINKAKYLFSENTFYKLEGSVITFQEKNGIKATLNTPESKKYSTGYVQIQDYEQLAKVVYRDTLNISNTFYESFWDDVTLINLNPKPKPIEYTDFLSDDKGDIEVPLLNSLPSTLMDPSSPNYIGNPEDIEIIIKKQGYQNIRVNPYTKDGDLRDLNVVGLKDNKTKIQETSTEINNLSEEQVQNLLKDKKTADWYAQKKLLDMIIKCQKFFLPLILTQIIDKFGVTNPLELIEKIKKQKDNLKLEKDLLNKKTNLPSSQKSKAQDLLKSKSQDQLSNLLDQYTGNFNFCPDGDSMEEILNIKNLVTSQLNQLMKIIDVTTKILGLAVGFIELSRILYTALKFSPLPIPPFAPTFLVGLIEDSKDEIQKGLGKASKITSGTLAILVILRQILSTVINLLDLLDTLIQQCSPANDDDGSNPVLDQLRQIAEIDDVANNTKTQNQINGFKLEIETENNESSLKRKRAVARNTDGVISLRGEWSYSSNEQILKNELIFYITQNNLKAN